MHTNMHTTVGTLAFNLSVIYMKKSSATQMHCWQDYNSCNSMMALSLALNVHMQC